MVTHCKWLVVFPCCASVLLICAYLAFYLLVNSNLALLNCAESFCPPVLVFALSFPFIMFLVFFFFLSRPFFSSPRQSIFFTRPLPSLLPSPFFWP